tara:strand:- start:1548 stop:2570 length:1023 start_codon:yes stop_codon:yes gene_type:complete
MNLQFDIERSKNTNPPNYIKGINFVERKAGRLDELVTTDENGVSLQPREKEKETGATLRNSFEAHGVLYDRQVMVAERRKDNKEELISGFNRQSNLLDMGIKHYFYDLVTFDSPLDKVIAKRSLNATADHTAKGTPNNDNDYLKGLREAHKISPLKTEKEVKRVLRQMSLETLSDYQVKLLCRKFLKYNTLHANVVALDAVLAEKVLKELELPRKGYVNDPQDNAYGRIGYAKHHNNSLSQIPTWIDLYDKYQVPIEIYGFVVNVNPANIQQQRERVYKNITDGIEWIRTHCFDKYKDIIEFKGFIAQISSPNPADGGKRKERGIVDINGNIIIDTPDGL